MTTTIGVLSDTHLETSNARFMHRCEVAFGHCEYIIHAGDLTNPAVLDSFGERQVIAVHGNMCNDAARRLLPARRQFVIDNVRFGLTHGTGRRDNIEERMFETFPDVDCIVFGHSHLPLCRRIGHILLFNPGSFQGTGRFGAPGTYGIITLDNGQIDGRIYELGHDV